jgi:hypothetical protein
MFENILNYIKTNTNKKLLVFFLEDYSDNNISELIFFLDENGYDSKLINNCIIFENNSNEILVAGRFEHNNGYIIDNQFYYYINESGNIKNYIKKVIVCELFKIKFNKNITIQKFFKKF